MKIYKILCVKLENKYKININIFKTSIILLQESPEYLTIKM